MMWQLKYQDPKEEGRTEGVQRGVQKVVQRAGGELYHLKNLSKLCTGP